MRRLPGRYECKKLELISSAVESRGYLQYVRISGTTQAPTIGAYHKFLEMP